MPKQFLCMECLHEGFTAKVIDVPQSFKGQEFTVKAEMMVCDRCNWFTSSDEQADRLCELAEERTQKLSDIIDLSEDRVKCIVLNARPSKWAATRRELVANLFGCGSTTAQKICLYFELDPYETIKNPHWPEEEI